MPELPEVETTKTSLLPLLEQKVLRVNVRQPSLRWPIPADIQRLAGQLTRQPLNVGRNRPAQAGLAHINAQDFLFQQRQQTGFGGFNFG